MGNVSTDAEPPDTPLLPPPFASLRARLLSHSGPAADAAGVWLFSFSKSASTQDATATRKALVADGVVDLWCDIASTWG